MPKLWYFISTLAIPLFESGRELAPQTVMSVPSIERYNARASARPMMSRPQPESGQVKMDLKGPEDLYARARTVMLSRMVSISDALLETPEGVPGTILHWGTMAAVYPQKSLSV